MSVTAAAEPPSAHDLTAHIRQAATREFAFGIHLKPDLSTLGGRAREFAPLVVREVTPEVAGPRFPPCFFEVCDLRRCAFPSWLPGCASNLRAASLQEGSAIIDGVKHDQITFFWKLRFETPIRSRIEIGNERSPSYAAATIGIRITLGTDGFPVVWEVLDSRSGHRILYVSRAAESRARAQFGEPLGGRQFAIERAAEEVPHVILVRILDDGPVPMGPYLYVDMSDRITSVLCRCNPAQVDKFVEEDTYQILSVTEAEEALDINIRPIDLDAALRWPQGL